MARAGYPVPDKRLPAALASILRNPPDMNEAALEPALTVAADVTVVL
eukprot:CAMPEP_0185913808 /NCGR_PEP_ID=MMETSP0924C-20121207/584_1 /TAXON_ID=321610 /ORGANISM="Perkinsus chesapeaki, Strain ATCC PRA-65" /LENGTH=46 /DNA_ID= /DNA_START= /DNA_END= /DNA_ORIENTATION=